MAWATRHRLILSVALVILVASGVRLVFYHQLVESRRVDRLLVDAQAYDRAARGILDGSWPGARVYYQDPLYPYFLAGVYRTLSDRPRGVVIVQMTIGVVSAGLVALLAGLVFGPFEAVLAGLLTATYKLFPFYEGLLLKPTLGVFLTCAALLALVAARRRGLIMGGLSGLLLGAAALVRANLLAQVPLVLVWLIWPGKGVAPRRRFGRAVAHLAGLGLMLAPFALHNIQCGELVLTTAQAGQNFYTGNNPGNNTGTYRPPRGVRAHPFFEEEDFRRLAEEEVGHPLEASEVSSFWWRKALDWMSAEPLAAARLFARKIAMMLNHVEVPDNVSFDESRRELAMLRFPMPVFWLVLALAAGALALHRWRPESLLLVLSGGLMVFSVALFFVFARYRLTLVPVLVVFAAALPRAVALRWRERARGRLAVGCLAVGAALGVSWLSLYEPSEALVAYNQAVDAYHEHRLDDAMADLDAALAEDGKLVQARLMRAGLLVEGGRVDAARADLEVALPLARGTPREPRALVLMGRLYAAGGRPLEAIDAFERALVLDPGTETAAVQAALVERSLRRRAAARQRLEAFVSGHPDAPGALNLLGVLCAETGDRTGAERAFREALRADPRDSRAQANLARCLEQDGRRDEALELYRRLLQEEPQNETVRRKIESLSGGR